MTPNETPAHTVELRSAQPFALTLARLTSALEAAGMTIFARIDHHLGAQNVGLSMPPTTVLIYGNPRGGTPLMLEAPSLALDLPLRVLVREDSAGATLATFHPALVLTRAVGLADDRAAALTTAEALIEHAIAM